MYIYIYIYINKLERDRWSNCTIRNLYTCKNYITDIITLSSVLCRDFIPESLIGINIQFWINFI